MPRLPVVLSALACALVLAGCAGAPGTAVPNPVPTVAAPVKATDYGALRTSLLTPLGGLIVATRNQSATRPQQLAAFNAAAEAVEPAIAGDMSVNANRLHSVIVNTRDAAARGDLETLERQRLELLRVG